MSFEAHAYIHGIQTRKRECSARSSHSQLSLAAHSRSSLSLPPLICYTRAHAHTRTHKHTHSDAQHTHTLTCMNALTHRKRKHALTKPYCLHVLTNTECTLQQEPALTKTQLRTYPKHTYATQKLSLSRSRAHSLPLTHARTRALSPSLSLSISLSLSLSHTHSYIPNPRTHPNMLT